ncbi:MAG: CmcJ/NvfI family oxidoreductase, partial [Rhodospirillaceae bacterium]
AVDRTGYTFRLAHNPSHSWVYFPFMQFDEVMLIKSYDSKEDGVARFTPHTAFVDPFTKSDALPRQSIESRIFAFF